MASANSDQSAEMEQITFTTSGLTADFESKCKGCILHATEDVYISFDRPVQTGDFFLKGDTMFYFPIEFTQISALQVSSSGTLYIIGIR